ncbi:hypothetical protein BDB01DRAFT_780557 [Pilobolus umbonatus]|nr:hypothetical protein BDB01DRAFT_780557 [Pilobolus umbonatus]
MESLIDEASLEVRNRLSVYNITETAMNQFDSEINTCKKRVTDSAVLANKIDAETTLVQDMYQSLNEKIDQIETTFDRIDQLEILVNIVKNTYNAVAENLDRMERAVNASTPTSLPFNIGARRMDIPVQPYFPPPDTVDIYDTNELLSRLSL